MISYKEPVEKDFYKSHVWEKIERILLIHYFREKELKNNLLYRINYVNLFTPTEKDMVVIIEDYNVIIGKIEAGKAHELSEADTNYLGACTKGATAEKSLVFQEVYAPEIQAKKRAFCYKTSYMTYVLNEYVLKKKVEVESIVPEASLLKGTTFDQYVQGLINKHVGKTDRQLCEQFHLAYTNNKAQWNTLAFRMLGIKSNRAEEFEKANIIVKTIRVEENGTIREHMSLPPVSLNKVAHEEWEDSNLREYFDESKFLFVVFKKNGEEYRLQGARLWHMPIEDLDGDVREGWLNIQDIIKGGITFTVGIQKNKVVVNNNLPGSGENPIIHIRPHASKRYYKFADGKTLGDGTPSMAEELPDGRWMPKQGFWLNSSYIKKIISDVQKA
jgi:DNA mismatch repair protein MutH